MGDLTKDALASIYTSVNAYLLNVSIHRAFWLHENILKHKCKYGCMCKYVYMCM